MNGSGLRQRGFTLLEAVVSGAIVAVLLAVAIPALSHVRLSGKATSSLSLASETSKIHLVYVADHGGRMFAGEIDDRVKNTYTAPDGKERMFFLTHTTWSADIGKAYVPSGRASEFNSPFDPDNEQWGDFAYSCALTTQPGFWNRVTRTGPGQWHAPLLSQAISPSKKILTFDRVLWDGILEGTVGERYDLPLIASFLDGSSDRLRSASVGYFKGDGAREWAGGFHTEPSRDGLHTLGGIAGRDRD